MLNPFNPNESVPLLKATSYSQLFEQRQLWPLSEVSSFKLGELDSKGYCQVTVVGSSKHFDALRVQPTAELGTVLSERMLRIDNDQIYFEVIVYGDHSSRVYAKYNQILGSRLVAKFDAKETKAFFRKLLKEFDYNTLPRVRKEG